MSTTIRTVEVYYSDGLRQQQQHRATFDILHMIGVEQLHVTHQKMDENGEPVKDENDAPQYEEVLLGSRIWLNNGMVINTTLSYNKAMQWLFEANQFIDDIPDDEE